MNNINEKQEKKKKVKIQLKSPSQDRSRQTVTEILNACSTLIINEGFFSVTTDKIAKEANVSIGSLYQFFGNKESVVSAVIHNLLENDLRYFEENTKNVLNLPKEEIAKKIISVGIDIYKTHRELRSKIQTVQIYLTDTTFYQTTMKQYQMFITQFITPKPGVNPETTAFVIVNAFLGVMNTISLENRNLDQEDELISEVYSLLLPLFS